MVSILDGGRVAIAGLPEPLEAYRLPRDQWKVQGGAVAVWHPETQRWVPATPSKAASLRHAVGSLTGVW